MSPKHIFISRALTDSSPFHNLVNEDHILIADSLIKFNPILPEVIPQTDWIFFYSKKAFQFFVRALNDESQVHYLDKKIGALGSATASFIESCLGRKIEFTGPDDPDKLLKAFSEILGDESLLIPRAANSRQRLEESFTENLVFSLPVYENEVDTRTFPIPFDIAIFTSPLNAQAFFQANTSIPKHIIAIGKTTESEIRTLLQDADIEILIPASPSELALYNLCRKVMYNEK